MLRGLAYNACTIVVTAVHFSSSLGPNRSEPEKNGTKGKYARTHARTHQRARGLSAERFGVPRYSFVTLLYGVGKLKTTGALDLEDSAYINTMCVLQQGFEVSRCKFAQRCFLISRARLIQKLRGAAGKSLEVWLDSVKGTRAFGLLILAPNISPTSEHAQSADDCRR